MSALVPALFLAAALFALSSIQATVRRYAGAVLALDAPALPDARPRRRRAIASASRVPSPRRAAMRARRISTGTGKTISA